MYINFPIPNLIFVQCLDKVVVPLHLDKRGTELFFVSYLPKRKQKKFLFSIISVTESFTYGIKILLDRLDGITFYKVAINKSNERFTCMTDFTHSKSLSKNGLLNPSVFIVVSGFLRNSRNVLF